MKVFLFAATSVIGILIGAYGHANEMCSRAAESYAERKAGVTDESTMVCTINRDTQNVSENQYAVFMHCRSDENAPELETNYLVTTRERVIKKKKKYHFCRGIDARPIVDRDLCKPIDEAWVCLKDVKHLYNSQEFCDSVCITMEE